MSWRGKKLGLLLSAHPETGSFRHGLGVAGAALEQGVDVYLYCLDDAVHGVADERLQGLRRRGLKLYACAYGAQERGIPVSDLAVFAGLSSLNDLIVATDRFLSFN